MRPQLKLLPLCIPPKTLDATPIDFCTFGILNRALFKRHPKALGGFWKIVKEEWNKINFDILKGSLLFWKSRCNAIV